MEADFLSQLNSSQREAVTYCDGPQLVIAGAGSGKTRVLTYKIAYLLRNGYHSDEILALTFTKKAATEMKNRVNALVGPALSRRLWMGTFHSVFARILRKEAERIGYKRDFTIYDQTDSRSLFKTIIKEMQLDDKKYKPASVQAYISNMKNNLITPSMYRANPQIMDYDRKTGRSHTAEIYQRYWNRCRQAGAMDFDDLLLYTNILFRDFPEVLDFWQKWFRYVLVDEYQDTNRAQHLIVEQLVSHHHHLTAVGDDAQSIYSFRGANIHNILDMTKSIPGTVIFKLEQNYRSTQNIVEAANSLIAKNRQQIPKTIFSEKERGSLLRLTGNYSDLEEAYRVTQQIAELHDRQHFRYADCAILYRTNAQSRSLEENLRKNGIDYRIYGGLSFYQRKEIKDVLAYMRLTVNPADEEAFKRVVNYPARGIGDTTVTRISEAATQLGKSFYEICQDPIAHGVKVNRPTAERLHAFTSLIDNFRATADNLNAYETAVEIITQSGIKADLGADNSVEGKSRQENVQELLSAIDIFVQSSIEEGRQNETHLMDFLQDVSLSGDVEPTEQEDAERDCVSLMTIHSAKGLEFPNVFIVGLEEGLFPNDMSFNELGGIEEERRLFYVAITRAEVNCFLSYAKSRFRNGRSEANAPSRFIKDIDRRYIRQTNDISATTDYSAASSGSFRGVFRAGAPQSGGSGLSGKSGKSGLSRISGPFGTSGLSSSSSVTRDGTNFSVGDRIRHNVFGEGVITAIEGQGDNTRLKVQFSVMGLKTLLLKFAKLEKL